MKSWKTTLLSIVVLALVETQHARTTTLITSLPPQTSHTQPHRLTHHHANQLPTCNTLSTTNHNHNHNLTNTNTNANTNTDLVESQQNTQQTIHTTLKDVNISFLPNTDSEFAASIRTLPLIITPRSDTSLNFLKTFFQQNREWLNEQLTKHGAILVQGFDVSDEFDVQSAVQAFQPDLNNSYRGTSPRSTQHGSEYVFSAAEVPSYYPIFQHLEMSFLEAPPKQLFFSALRAPKTVGGETAIADFRKVYQDLPESLRNKLAQKKIRYRRTHHREGAKGFTRDVASLQGWPDVFGTDDKTRVEQIAAAENTPVQWVGQDNDTFVSETFSDAFQLHPVTGEPVWFNHAQVFHWTTFPAELFFAFRRTGQFRFLWHGLVVSAFSIVKYGILGHKMALDASFGDGTPISIWEAHQIRQAIHKNMVFNRWQEGDILMIDNWSTSHGRQPTYDSGRKVVVAWSDPMKKPNLYQQEYGHKTLFLE